MTDRKQRATNARQPKQASLPASTLRNRVLRERRRAGVEVASLPVQLFGWELDELVARGLLKPETRLDRDAIAGAVEQIVAEWIDEEDN